MIGTIIDGNFDIDHRITSYNTVFQSCFYAGLDRVDEFLWNDAANDSVFEFESLPGSIGSRRSQQWPYWPWPPV